MVPTSRAAQADPGTKNLGEIIVRDDLRFGRKEPIPWQAVLHLPDHGRVFLRAQALA